jgi:tetratricopeptide (TPR) repeat protein
MQRYPTASLHAIALTLLAGSLCALPMQAQTSQPASAGTAAPASDDPKALTAESLLSSANNLVLESQATPGRAGRLLALTHLAEELAPGDWRIQRLLADIYQSQGKDAQTASALKICLQARPADYALGVRWLQANLAQASDADSRSAILVQASQDTAWPGELRAQAFAMLGQIHQGQADNTAAGKAFAAALELDPCNPSALNGLANTTTNPTTFDRAKTLLMLVQGNPTYAAGQWELAGLLDEIGLYEQSILFYDHAWNIIQLRQLESNELPQFLAQYLSAMLDLSAAKQDPDQALRAVSLFQPMLQKNLQNIDLHAMVVEACLLANQPKMAQPVVMSMEVYYQQQVRLSPGKPSAALAGEMAWFYLMTANDPKQALIWAGKAQAVGGDSPVIQRIIAAAKLASPDTDEQTRDQCMQQLTHLADKDPFAAYILATQYDRLGKPEEAKKAIQAGLALTRNGPAFRKLFSLGQKLNVQALSLAASSATTSQAQADADVPRIAKLIGDFDKRYLELAKEPEKYLKITLSPAQAIFAPGEPIEINATLSALPASAGLQIPIGTWGLLNATMALQAKTHSLEDKVFSNLPLVVWPAPRYMTAGDTVTTSVQIDAAGLGRYLFNRPLEAITLTMEGLADPIQHATTLRTKVGDELPLAEQFASSLPQLKPDPVNIDRPGLPAADAAGKTQASIAIAAITAGLASPTIAGRMQACRQVDSMLVYAQLVEQNKLRVAGDRLDDASRQRLLQLLAVALADKSSAVRAEALAGLQNVELDAKILDLLAPAITDPSPVVRLRVAEALGVSGLYSRVDVLKFLAKDKNQWVSLAARAMADQGDKN